MLNPQAAPSTMRFRLRQDTARVKVLPRPVSSSAELSELFADILPRDCANIVSAARTRDFLPRETIYFSGDPITEILLLTAGSLKITQVGENGGEVILRLEGPGGVFGFHESVHICMAQALLPSRALVWNAATFEALSERFPLLRRNMMGIVVKRLRMLEGRFREISTERVAPRLARELVRSLLRVGRRVHGALEINLSREELAQMTATTMFTVSRLLASWERQGIVSLGRESVTVRNPLGLVGLSETK